MACSKLLLRSKDVSEEVSRSTGGELIDRDRDGDALMRPWTIVRNSLQQNRQNNSIFYKHEIFEIVYFGISFGILNDKSNFMYI